MYIYLIDDFQGEIKPSAEIEEIHWLSIDEYNRGDFQLGSILQQIAVPMLVADEKMY